MQLPATATATLLVVDAWFDVMTAGGRKADRHGVLMAVCVELPAAVFSLWLARRVNHNAERMALAATGRWTSTPAGPDTAVAVTVGSGDDAVDAVHTSSVSRGRPPGRTGSRAPVRPGWPR